MSRKLWTLRLTRLGAGTDGTQAASLAAAGAAGHAAADAIAAAANATTASAAAATALSTYTAALAISTADPSNTQKAAITASALVVSNAAAAASTAAATASTAAATASTNAATAATAAATAATNAAVVNRAGTDVNGLRRYGWTVKIPNFMLNTRQTIILKSWEVQFAPNATLGVSSHTNEFVAIDLPFLSNSIVNTFTTNQPISGSLLLPVEQHAIASRATETRLYFDVNTIHEFQNIYLWCSTDDVLTGGTAPADRQFSNAVLIFEVDIA